MSGPDAFRPRLIVNNDASQPDRRAALPHNLEAEMSLLGAILTDNRCFETVADFLLPHHFADALHMRIYEMIRDTLAAGRRADQNTLRQSLEDPAFREVGHGAYLGVLVESVIALNTAADYGRLLVDLWVRRELINQGWRLIDDAYQAGDDTPGWTLAERHVAVFDQYAQVVPGQRRTNTAKAALAQAMDQAQAAYRAGGRIVGRTSGLSTIDDETAGLHDGDLVVVAGRPGAGKSAFVLGTILANAGAGVATGFFSLEMPAAQIGQRIIAWETGISVSRQRKGALHEADWEAMTAAQRRLDELPLLIEDDASLTIERIRTRARTMKFRRGVGLIVIDHLQRMPWSDRLRTEQEALTHAVKGCKSMATELQVPVVLLCQLSREVDKRDNKRPVLADLRGSGMIEAEADQVLMLYRGGYYGAVQAPVTPDNDKRRPRYSVTEEADRRAAAAVAEDEGEIIIAKNRHGRSPVTLNVGWDGPRMKFFDKAAVEGEGSLWDR